MKRYLKLGAAAMLLSAPTAALAGEGGASVYIQGTFNDFAVAAPAPSGVYVRNDLAFYHAGIGGRPLGGTALAVGVSQNIWIDLTKVAYVSDFKILGGTYSAATVVPIIINAEVGGSANNGTISGFLSGSRGGFGDVFLIPAQLNWTLEEHSYLSAALNINVPVGAYDTNRIINLGRNYWAFDPTLSYTWLDPANGYELSFTSGMMFNTENTATHYTTGTEFHLDWLVSQHFSKAFALGMVGYLYQQISDDHGNIPAFLPAGFRGSGMGLGPAALWTVPVGNTSVNLIGKVLFDVEAENRMKGNVFMLSAALKL